MGLTNYAKNTMLDFRFKGKDCFVGLINEEGEVGAEDYVRQALTVSAAEEGQAVNSNDVFFPIASSTWGRIVKVGVYDAEVEGTLLAESSPEWIKLIDPGSQYHIPENMMIIRLL